MNVNSHKLVVSIKAESNNGQDYSESQRRTVEEYLVKNTGGYLASQGFHGEVRVERESIFSKIGARLFG